VASDKRKWLDDPRTVDFRQMVRAARGSSHGVAGIGEALETHGISRDWLRDRDWGRAPVLPEDLVTLRALLDTAAATVTRYGAVSYAVRQTASATLARARRGEVAAMREVVAAFCVQCSDKACYDATCLLRPISPLPLASSAHRNDPLSSS